MIVDINDSLELKDLDLYIAKPNLDRQIIGHLTEAFNKSYYPKMGNLSELSFTIPYQVEKNHEIIDNPNIDKVKDRFFIKAIYDGKTEWFRINEINESSDDNGELLEVHAYSLGIELGDKTVHLVDETSKDVQYMMELCLSNTLWDVGFIDNDLYNVYRSFDVTEMTKLNFLYEIAETFKGVLVWNTVDRTVDLRTQDNVGNNFGLRISYGKYMKSINKESDSNQMVTRLIPHGRDGLSIHSVSPTGLSHIDDFSYFMYPFHRDENGNVLRSSHYMSDSLCNALLDYAELLESKDGQFQSLLSERETLTSNYLTKQNELVTLEMAMNQILDSIDIEKANNRDYSNLETDRVELQSQIDAKQSEIDSIESQLNTNQSNIDTLQNILSTENNFTNNELLELNTYIIEKHWSDENIINADDLYKEAKKQFDELRKPATVFNIDIVNFTQILEGQKDWGKLNVGDTIYIHHERLGENLTAKIIEFEIDFEDQSVKLTIANTKDILSAEEKFYQRLYEADMTSATINTNKYRWKNDSDKVTEIERVIEDKWDATKRRIVAGVNESVTFDERGLKIINPNYPNQILVGQAGVLAVSDDGGNTWKHAITSDGIVGEQIYGKLGVFAKIRSDQILIEADGTETTVGGKINDVESNLDEKIETVEDNLAGDIYDAEQNVTKYANEKDEKLREDLRLENPLPSSMKLNSTGVHVDDQYGNNRVRLGQYATGKYGLLIRNKQGNATILDEDGIMQTWQEGRTDNVDSYNPLTLYVYIPPETQLIRKAILRFRRLPFRAYSRGTENDGYHSDTTSNGGFHSDTTGSGGGNWDTTESGGFHSDTTEVEEWSYGPTGHNHGIKNGTMLQLAGNNGSVTWVESGQHTHEYRVPNHSHEFYIPNHSHSFSVPSHSHSFSVPSHSHDIDYGIYESTTANYITVYINGYNRTYSLGGSFTSNQDNLNITNYLNIGQWNTIELGSSRLGRIDATVFIQAFIGM